MPRPRATVCAATIALLAMAAARSGCVRDHSLAHSGAQQGAAAAIAAGATNAPDDDPRPAGVRVFNHTDDPLHISAREVPLGTLFSGEDALWPLAATGPARLLATTADGTERFATTLDVQPGQLPQWHLDPPRALAEFVNLTDEGLRITTDSGELVRLEPGERRHVTDLAPGSLRCTAHCLRSRCMLDAELVLESGETTAWAITREPGTAIIRNPSEEPIEVRANGGPALRVNQSGSATLQGLSPGPTTLRAEGVLSGGVAIVDLDLESGEMVHWDARMEWAALTVNNKTNETLIPAPHLHSQHPEIPPGTSRDFILRPGPRKMTMVAETSGFEHVEDIVFAGDQRSIWTVTEVSASIRIQNHRGESVRVALGDEHFVVVAAHDDVLVAPLPRGPLTLQADGLASGWTHEERVRLDPERPHVWTLRYAPAGLRLSNDTPEKVSVYIDGRSLGELPAGDVAHYGPFATTAPGAEANFVRATAIGLRTGHWHAMDLQPAEGRVDPWNLRLPDARMRIRNLSAIPQHVHVPDQLQAEVPPGGELTTFLRAEPLSLHSTHASGTRTTTWTPLPGQVHAHDLLPANGTIVVDNTTNADVHITWGDLDLGTVQSSHRALLRDLPPRALTLRATNSDASATWQLTHRVVPEAILYWRIDHSQGAPE